MPGGWSWLKQPGAEAPCTAASPTSGAVLQGQEGEELLEVWGAEQHLGSCSCTKSRPARKLCMLVRDRDGNGTILQVQVGAQCGLP